MNTNAVIALRDRAAVRVENDRSGIRLKVVTLQSGREPPSWLSLRLNLSTHGNRVRSLTDSKQQRIDRTANDIDILVSRVIERLHKRSLHDDPAPLHQLVYIDAIDVAWSYGQTRGVPDFIGLFIALESLDALGYAVRVCIFEDDLVWWEKTQKTEWDQETYFLSQLRKEGILQILQRVLTSDCVQGPPRYLVDVKTEKAVTALQLCTFQSANEEARADRLRLTLTSSCNKRTLGQVEKLVARAAMADALLMSNDWRQYETLALLDAKLFEYACQMRCLYFYPTKDTLALSRDNKAVHKAGNI